MWKLWFMHNWFDKIIDNKSHYNNEHKFEAIEIPVLASGFAIHYDYVYKFFFQKPFIGTCFECQKCQKYLCQNCYLILNIKMIYILEKIQIIN